MMLLVWSFLTGLMSACVSATDTYSASARLELLVAAQNVLINQLETLVPHGQVSALTRALDQLRNVSYTSHIAGNHGNPQTATISGHPVNAHHVITGWARVGSLASQSLASWPALRDHLSSHVGISLPSSTDVDGSIRALIRLQDTYDLSTSDLAQGLIRGVRALTPLTAHDQWLLGKESIRQGDLVRAVEWLTSAGEDEEAAELPLILKDLASAYQLMGHYSQAVRVLRQAPPSEHDGEIAKKLEFYEELERTLTAESRSRDESHWQRRKVPLQTAYQELCRRQENSSTSTYVASNPSPCSYVTGVAPFILYPREVHSVDPYIVQYYHVITHNEASHLQISALSQLERALVGNEGNNDQLHTVSQARVGQVAWLHDESPGRLSRRLSDRVEVLTGLRTSPVNGVRSAEPFQVLNYGIGGHYEPHCDVIKESHHASHPNVAMGNRLATFMLYLNGVEAGGATVFPRLNIIINPVKHSAAFWYNLHSDGTSDDRTIHAGCPVLLGQKWVANKWIREHGQTPTCNAHPPRSS